MTGLADFGTSWAHLGTNWPNFGTNLATFGALELSGALNQAFVIKAIESVTGWQTQVVLISGLLGVCLRSFFGNYL